MAAAFRAHRHDDDFLYVLTVPTGCRVFYNLPHPHLLCRATRDRHGHQHSSAHALHYLTYSEETMQRSRRLGHHIHKASFTTAYRPLATLWSTKMTASTVNRVLHPWIVAPCSSRNYSTRNESTSTSNHPDPPAQIASPISASTPCVQMDRSGTSHPASEEGDHRLPPRGVPLAQKIKRPC
jgi:hypothetical protein